MALKLKQENVVEFLKLCHKKSPIPTPAVVTTTIAAAVVIVYNLFIKKPQEEAELPQNKMR